MSDLSENPPAYPFNELDQTSGNIFAQHKGMTLRDYFAAAALKGILSNLICMKNDQGDLIKTANEAAALAYKQADAMLKARQS